MILSDSLDFATSYGTNKITSLSSMTVDSIPISKLGQRGAGFLAAHGDALVQTIKAYAAIAWSSTSKFSLFAFMFS